LRRFRSELDKDVQQAAPETLEVLKRYSWPGNLRELQSVIKQAMLHATGPVLVPDFLPALVRDEGTSRPGSAQPSPAAISRFDQFIQERLQAGSKDLYAEVQALVVRQLITQVLRHTGNRLSQTARILGINRSTLRSKMGSLGITADSLGAADEV